MRIPDYIWKFIKSWEGGDTTTNDKDDTGGLTRWGMSQNNNPDVDVKNLTEDQAKSIYFKRYWTVAYCDEIPDFMQLIQFNCSVNCGPNTAIKTLQKAIGVKSDGVVGELTRKALKNYKHGAKRFTLSYLSWQCLYYFNIAHRRESQFKWLRGWVRRSLGACWETAVKFGRGNYEI